MLLQMMRSCDPDIGARRRFAIAAESMGPMTSQISRHTAGRPPKGPGCFPPMIARYGSLRAGMAEFGPQLIHIACRDGLRAIRLRPFRPPGWPPREARARPPTNPVRPIRSPILPAAGEKGRAAGFFVDDPDTARFSFIEFIGSGAIPPPSRRPRAFKEVSAISETTGRVIGERGPIADCATLNPYKHSSTTACYLTTSRKVN